MTEKTIVCKYCTREFSFDPSKLRKSIVTSSFQVRNEPKPRVYAPKCPHCGKANRVEV